jgi:hypothetical protein
LFARWICRNGKTFAALLAGNWPLIRKVAEDPEAGGKVKVWLSLNLEIELWPLPGMVRP